VEEKINQEFKIPKEELERRINHELSSLVNYRTIVPPKSIREIDFIMAMPIEELEAILRNIPLVSDKHSKSYIKSKFKFFRMDPSSAMMIQTFVLEEKLLNFHEGFGNLYRNFCFPGLSKMTAHYLMGRNSGLERVTGIYIPPIIEYVGGYQPVLIDGTHRGTLVHDAGTTTEVVGILNPTLPLPCEPLEWHKNIVKVKPPVEERFRNLNRKYFKDFGYVGIDG
jgi:hypothetical protein